MSAQQPGNNHFSVGDRVRWGESEEGVIVGVIERNEFVNELDGHRWAALRYGVLIRSSDGAITHVREASVVLRAWTDAK